MEKANHFLNNHKPNSGNDEFSTDDELHSDSENREVRPRVVRKIYKKFKPLAGVSSQSRHACLIYAY